MAPIVLSRAEFKDKILGCWLGKNIGGTLGTPHECKRFALGLEFYDPIPTEPLPNDDLDLQLVWLEMLEKEGVDPALPVFAKYWSKHAAPYPWNEYGFFMRNYTRGLRAPIAGCFENYFVDEMGSPIRSEIWGCLHPGNPQAAARMAWKDSAIDHSGGEGMWGEMFWSSLQAAAFVEKDPLTLIRIGLSMIPISSHVGRSIREAVWQFENKKIWGDAREAIATRFGGIQPCNAVVNHGFTILGWLYGKDFGDKLLKAVNCGYDTDCTGATLGATLGIIEGAEKIPANWIKPIGTGIVLHKFTVGLHAPKDVYELTDRTIALAEQVAKTSTVCQFGAVTKHPADMASTLFRNDQAAAIRAQDVHAAIEIVDGKAVALHYGGDPVLRPNEPKVVGVSVTGETEPKVVLGVPSSWAANPLGIRDGRAEFELLCRGPVADRNVLVARLSTGKSVEFAMLGPGEAKGFAAGANVQKCPKCHARVEACVC
ncbi:MAG TPA: ADP-ribosylglycohydrolase family protein [Planctomycetota bacterium]|nr:ADP-ribosylglycohydrolase family protein [Planctomycetota bacterium]